MISVIICTYNRDKYILTTLERLAGCRYEGAWEIVLVNNNCTDTTDTLCSSFHAQHPEVPFRYFIEEKQGLSHARNRGMKEAQGDWLVFLDDDAFVGENYLQRLEQYIRELPDMCAFGGKILPFFETGEAPDWLCKWNRSWLSAIDKGNAVCLFEGKEYPIGANMGFARSAAEACGYFDTTLGRSGKNLIGGEEKDYFNRIKALDDAKIYYLPEIPVEHCIPPGRTTRDYILRLGKGVGMSERMRTKGLGQKKYLLRLCAEGIKWAATILLWCRYFLAGTRAKGDSLVLFRKEVTKGLLGSE